MHSVRFKKEAFNTNDLIPTKILCLGRNYQEHAKELNNEIPLEPILFIKPNSSLDTQLRNIHSEPLHFEAELCFLILGGHIAGLGFGLDLTKRQLQDRLKKQGLPWERSKAFNSAAIFSDFVPCPTDLSELRLEFIVNNELRQAGGVREMLFKPQTFLDWVSEFMSIEDGDILMTGTPSGVGTVIAGDQYLGRIYNGEHLLIEQTWTVP